MVLFLDALGFGRSLVLREARPSDDQA